MEKKESKAVLARIANFEKQKAYFEVQGYTCKKVCVGALKANIVAFIIMLAAAFIGFASFFAIYDKYAIIPFMTLFINEDDSFLIPTLLFVICFLVLTIVHELIHALGWGIFCKKHFSSIQFGIIWKGLMPYCSCLEALSWKAYIFGVALPFLILGLGFYIYAMIFQNFLVLMFAIVNVAGAGGDLMIMWYLLKDRPHLLLDLPNECGYMMFIKE